MRIPFNWLKEIVDPNISAEKVADLVTMGGLETTVIEYTKEGEPILEVDILPNRGDCNSILGTAREVSAVTGAKLKTIKSKVKEISKKSSSVLKVEIRDLKLCSRYMARVIENVTIKDSPIWLKEKLSAAGMRPINNIVDVTNYILLELGQPMHAFDLSLIQGQKIVVRAASSKEKITTLDKIERELDKDILVIADSNRAIAVAGIMGAANTEVSTNTKTIILESASFNSISISKSSKLLKLRTEASSRFEKTVDWNMVETALNYAAQLIAELSGGNILSGAIDVKGKEKKQPIIELRYEKLNSVLGMEISEKDTLKILNRLGFAIQKKNAKLLKVEVPSWRVSDIEGEIDLIEEIARIYGYNKVPVTNPKIRRNQVTITTYARVSKIKDIMIGTGLNEVQTFSLVDPSDTKDESIKITNPMTVSESVMRTTMLPSILRVVSHNIRHQIEDIRIFEVGKVFNKKGAERLVLAGAISYPKAEFFDIKGIIETLVSEFSLTYKAGNLDSSWYNPSKSCVISIDNKQVAKLGLLHPEISKKFDLTKDTFVFEIDIEGLLALKTIKQHSDLPRYPKVDRDIAMFVPDGVSYDQIITLIKEESGPFLEEVKLFDVYKNSQAYRLSFRNKNATLTDEVVNERFVAVIGALEQKLRVQVRK